MRSIDPFWRDGLKPHSPPPIGAQTTFGQSLLFSSSASATQHGSPAIPAIPALANRAEAAQWSGLSKPGKRSAGIPPLRMIRLASTLLLLSLLLIGLCAGAQICEISVVQSPANACRGDMVILSASVGEDELAVPALVPNSQRGVMLDVEALQGIRLKDISVQVRGLTDVQVWYKIGTYIGFENTPGVWTLLGTVSGVDITTSAQRLGLDLDLYIPAGQVYGLYITSTNPLISLDYSNGTGTGSVMSSDERLRLREGSGVDYPFGAGSGVFPSRRFVGSIHYTADALYSWSDGLSGASRAAIAGSSELGLSVSIPDLGCSLNQWVEVQGLPARVLPAQALLCDNQSRVLDAGPGGEGGGSYLWSNGHTGRYLTLDGPDFAAGWHPYWVDVQTGGVCAARDSVRIRAAPAPIIDLPANQVLCNTAELLLDPGTDPSWTYIWHTGATTSSLYFAPGALPIGFHTFSLTVSNPLGCESNTGAFVDVVSCTGLEGPLANEKVELSLWPVPARDRLFISSSFIGRLSYDVFDNKGRMVQQGEFAGRAVLPLQLASGLYYLRLSNGQSARFVVQ